LLRCVVGKSKEQSQPIKNEKKKKKKKKKNTANYLITPVFLWQMKEGPP
jgi:hypothetical protein